MKTIRCRSIYGNPVDVPVEQMQFRIGVYAVVLSSRRFLSGPSKTRFGNTEREVIQAALKAYGEDKRRAAKLLDISLSSLYRKISDFDANEPGVGENLSAGGNGSRFPNN